MADFEVTIDDKRCKGCAICVAVCPKQCLAIAEAFNQAGYYYPAMKNAGDCTGCGACAKLCPDFAVTVYEIVEEGAKP
jgi:2-oxoglutarate ferredoxin oxidoreductase subunit delta